LFGKDECGSCLVANCCSVSEQCNADATCHMCLWGGMADCDANALYTSFKTCHDGPCGNACASTCNPVTNEGCTGGETCDYDISSKRFICWGGSNVVAICGQCNGAVGPFCAPGETCGFGHCQRYCCDSGDCGSGFCDKTLFAGLSNSPVGACVITADGGREAACDAPVVSQSMGACGKVASGATTGAGGGSDAGP
jgi:hypothetical protein